MTLPHNNLWIEGVIVFYQHGGPILPKFVPKKTIEGIGVTSFKRIASAPGSEDSNTMDGGTSLPCELFENSLFSICSQATIYPYSKVSFHEWTRGRRDFAQNPGD
jgi:hypothetical protein